MGELPKTADIVVIGGGVMGASAAYHLAKRGAGTVVLLERETFFGAGATGRCAGGIRHQFATEVNIKLSLHSLRMLDEFETETGQPAMVRKCGYLLVATHAGEVRAFEKNVNLQRALGVPTQWLGGDEVRRLLPMCQFDDALAATFCPDDGLADPNSVVMGYINAARRSGARCHTEVSVIGVEVGDGKLQAVHTDKGTIATPCAVNAAGPWSAPVAQMAGLPLPVMPFRRQWLTTTPLPQLPDDFPFVIDFGQSLYFHREGGGLLTGMTNIGQAAGDDQSVDMAWELVHLEAAVARLPMLENAGVVARCAGLYETTPDAHPIIGASPIDGFYLLCGFSGHGFMHGPIGGKVIAEVICDGSARTVDVSALDYNRFAEGREIREYNVI